MKKSELKEIVKSQKEEINFLRMEITEILHYISSNFNVSMSMKFEGSLEDDSSFNIISFLTSPNCNYKYEIKGCYYSSEINENAVNFNKIPEKRKKLYMLI